MDSHKVLGAGGEFADVVQFVETVRALCARARLCVRCVYLLCQIRKNMKLYELTNDVKLSTHAAAHYTRGEIAKLIRSNPHSVQSLLAGALQCARLPPPCSSCL